MLRIFLVYSRTYPSRLENVLHSLLVMKNQDYKYYDTYGMWKGLIYTMYGQDITLNLFAQKNMLMRRKS